MFDWCQTTCINKKMHTLPNNGDVKFWLLVKKYCWLTCSWLVDMFDVVWKKTHHKSSSACKSAALSADPCFLPKRFCADALCLIVTKSHQIDYLTFDESLYCQYCKDISYCEQTSVLWHLHSGFTVKTHSEVGFTNWRQRKCQKVALHAYWWALIVARPSNKELHKLPANTLYCQRISHAICLIAFKHSS